MSTAGSICAACSIALALLAVPAQAGPVAYWSLQDLAKADVLAVGRVESVTTSAAPIRQVGDRVPVHTCTAEVSVLRSLGKVPQRIPVKYECYKDCGPGVSDYPVFVRLERGQVFVFPLMRGVAEWRLIGDDGVGLLVPAIADAANGSAAAYPFLIDELANSYLFGSYPDMLRATRHGGMPPLERTHLLERLAAELKYGDPRWIDIATAALATEGIPRAPLDESTSFGALALKHIPESRRRPGVVRNMLLHSDVHGWGSAATLVPEFKDDPLLLQLLPGYLKKLHPGAVYIASWLARYGQMTLLPASLDAAVRMLDLPKVADVNELYSAANLLVRHGSEPQFERLLDALRTARDRDTVRYRELAQPVEVEDGPRILRMIAVLLDDERPFHSSTAVRHCDIAAARLQMIAKQNFGLNDLWKQDLAQRNAALARARTWLRSH